MYALPAPPQIPAVAALIPAVAVYPHAHATPHSAPRLTLLRPVAPPPRSTLHAPPSPFRSTPHARPSRCAPAAAPLRPPALAIALLRPSYCAPPPSPLHFYAALYAQVWCTYCAGLEPIRDLPSLATLPPPLAFPAPSPSAYANSTSSTPHPNPSTPNLTSSSHTTRWGCTIRRRSPTRRTARWGARVVMRAGRGTRIQRVLRLLQLDLDVCAAASGTHKKMWWPLRGTKGWTSDAGWVCMLDTSRSLLATALQQVGALPGGVPWVSGPPWPVVVLGLWAELAALEAREGGSGGFPPLLLELANACIAASWLGGKVSCVHGVPLPVNRQG
ncbi:hypothetical protein C8R44DRAFT_888201 [Mycena epipterygia]|nr:hypothetical protein C8R44DRAFT_888201 [Mycena epipterygia]